MTRRSQRLAIVLALLPLIPAAYAVESAPGGEKQLVVLRLHGPIQESPSQVDFTFDVEPKRVMHEMLRKLDKARDDDKVKGLLVVIESPLLGWAQMQELEQAFERFVESGKPLHCYFESVGAGPYMLATAASRVIMVPTGTLDVRGIYAESAYFKGLLDKLKLQADVIHVGDFKAAGEPFTRTEPSREAKENKEWLVQDLYDQMVNTIACGRDLSEERVRELIDQGPFHANEALAHGLVDETAYMEDYLGSLKKEFGEGFSFNMDYGAEEKEDVDFSNPFRFFRMLGEAMTKKEEPESDSIALIHVDGMIVTGKTEQGLFGDSGTVGSTTVRRALNRAARLDHVKAVVLRVNSPGGSALASEIIWHASRDLAESKPLIVSMGNMAASGGYYVSCGAHTIFAEPGTITGSIGVIGGKLVTRDLWDWAGITFDVTQRGANAGLFTTTRPWSDREREIIREDLERIYAEFTDRVAQGRKEHLHKELPEIAAGRVYTGRQAHELGLVDQLGGLQDAIQAAADAAELVDYKLLLIPAPRSFMDILVQSLTGDKPGKKEVDLRVRSRFVFRDGSPSFMDALRPMLERLEPQHADVIVESLRRIELLGRERALTLLPEILNIR